jgi:ERCC4-related helicase
MNITPYHAKYYAYELTKRYSSDNLEKLITPLMDAQVDLNPHQIEAALFAFKSPLSKGALLADEVGLGKTIEAGILISQKWAERKRKILIILPSNLRNQWNQELYDKFFLPSAILESKSFNNYLKVNSNNPFDRDEIVLCSYHFARNKADYIRDIRWDLIVIDEAHRLRNVYKPSNKIAKAIQSAISAYPKVLLTATPLQNTLLELYGLISFIDDFTFGDIKSYKAQFSKLTSEDNFDDLKARLTPVCKRTLRRQVLEYIRYTNRIPLTQEFIPTEEEQELYDVVSDYLRRQNLYALPASQRQLITLILRKLLSSSTFAIAGTLNSLLIRLNTKSKRVKVKTEMDDEFSDNFESFEELKDEWQDNGETQNEEDLVTEEELDAIKEEIKDLHKFRDLAESITHNAKGKELLTALKTGFSKAKELGANEKAVIFTESRRTQEYLLSVLSNTEYKDRIVLFNGSNNDEISKAIYKEWFDVHNGTDKVTGSKTADLRSAIVDYFKNKATIMIATEAAAEGINFQFCSLVINYDLPWNPQRIEQRIGRCHRYGQKYDVVVVNFLNKKNAADVRVHELLSEKFKLFSGVFGASDEVLGSIESGVDFEKRIAQIYQECRTEEEIQASFDALQKDMEIEIDEKMKLTRQKLLENFDEEVHEKLKVNLAESKEYLSKHENWLWQITRYYLEPYADFITGDHSFTLRENPFPEEKIHSGPYKVGKNIEDANIYRIGHPLAQRIINSCKSRDLSLQQLTFNYSDTVKKISILDPLTGKSGWLSLVTLTIDSFETEDHILFCGITDDGRELEIEQGQRLFSLSASVGTFTVIMPDNVSDNINKMIHRQETDILQLNAEHNGTFFDAEMEKLDKWAEDIKNSIEIKLKQLDKDIKTRKTEAKKILKLNEKVKAQKEIKEMEKKRNTLRQNLYQAQDEVDEKKERLIEEIEARLKQKMEKTELFTVRWSVI